MAGIQLNRQDFIDSAQRALDFIYHTLWKDNRLLSSYKDGKAILPAYLDDCAFLLEAILLFLQVRWRSDYLRFAQQLADNLATHFVDTHQGGFFFVADDHEKLLYRPKVLIDEAVPSGNAIAALALQRLGFLLGETRYLKLAEDTLKMFWPDLEKHPNYYVSALLALSEYLQPPDIIIIRGEEKEMQAWKTQCLQENFSPHRLCFAIDSSLQDLPAAFLEKNPADKTIAYVCQGLHCLPPVTDMRKL